ncbi:MAG: glycosyltransferase [Ignavibacteria bacterium]|jgi:glycosyltransferase involved in cell wall biosynthesis
MLLSLKRLYKCLPLTVKENNFIKKFFFVILWPFINKNESYRRFKKSEETTKELKNSLLNNHKLKKSLITDFNSQSLKGKKNILIIDDFICQPDRDSGSLRTYNMIKILLLLEFNVKFYPANRQYIQPYLQNLQQLGVVVLHPPYVSSLSKYLHMFGTEFSVVILSRVGIAVTYIEAVKKYCTNALVIFDTVDLHFLREKRGAQYRGDLSRLKIIQKLKRDELSVVRKSDITIVVSQLEKQIVKKEEPDSNVEIISNIHDLHGSNNSFRQRTGIIFIGDFRHQPNVDAVLFLIGKIIPLFQEQLAGVKTYIIGSNPPENILCYSSEDIIITGYVKDVSRYFNLCRVSVAPLLWGAGVKGKINMSMSHGVPVVATPIATEGIPCKNEFDILIASDSDSFAAAVVELYRNEELWNRLSYNCIENVKKYFSFDTAKNKLEQILIRK